MDENIKVRIDLDDETSEVCDLSEVKEKVEEALSSGSFATVIVEVDKDGEEHNDARQFGVEWTATVALLK